MSLTCTPALLLYAWLMAESVRWLARHRGLRTGRADAWLKVLVLALRPWAVWALFNLLCRFDAGAVFGNPLTFPLYANLWGPDRIGMTYLADVMKDPEFWVWTAMVLILTGISVATGVSALRGRRGGGLRTGLMAGALCVLAFLLWTSVASLPRGARVRGARDPGSYLAVWHTAGGTFLYNMPHVRSTGHFMRNFEQIQPQLRHTIHGVSHPPGAALSLYWIGRITGAAPERIRENREKIRYAVGLTVVAALNTAAVFLLAWALFGRIDVGMIAAILWLTSPAATAYATFSQDTVYALFFHLALAGSWYVVTGQHKVMAALGLGIVFSVLTMLTFSWCVATSVFAAFALWVGIRQHWSKADVMVRGILPLAVMTILTGAILLFYRLDYLAIYRFAHDYHNQWYQFTGFRQWTMALIGGQLEMCLMMGTVVFSICVGVLARSRLRSELSMPAHFFVTVLALYAIPIVFGPNPLKMETSRCWIWVLSLPIAFAAREIARTGRPVVWFAGAVTASVASSYVMRIFINFGS